MDAAFLSLSNKGFSRYAERERRAPALVSLDADGLPGCRGPLCRSGSAEKSKFAPDDVTEAFARKFNMYCSTLPYNACPFSKAILP